MFSHLWAILFPVQVDCPLTLNAVLVITALLLSLLSCSPQAIFRDPFRRGNNILVIFFLIIIFNLVLDFSSLVLIVYSML